MPIRVRKSFKVAPGVRVNLSNSGLSGSVGGGGVNYTTRRAGRKSSCCLNALVLLPVLLPARLVQLAYQRLRHR